MAIIKRPSKDGMKYQIKLQGSDGRWISETFTTRREAEQKEEELKRQKHGGTFVSGELRRLTLDQYFEVWHRDTEGMKASFSWRESQLQMYRTYVQPIIGSVKLQAVTPAMILRVLQSTKRMGRASPTVRHVYTLLHKIFRDAVEIHEMLDRNPVKRNQKPDLEEKEAEFLEIAEAKTLLNHVRGKPYEIPIWLGVFVGLRVGEVQALLWENIDLERGVIHVRRTYVRREKRFKEYPKGRRWHQVAIPPELWEILVQQRQATASKYVAVGPNPRVREGRPLLEYGRYLLALKGYLKEAGLKDLATHNLRHSTSGLWMEHGASDQDMRLLFAHSNDKVTQRYIHFQTARQLGKVANIIRLFPERGIVEKNSSSQNLPKSVLEKVDVNEGVC
jgi:integrase